MGEGRRDGLLLSRCFATRSNGVGDKTACKRVFVAGQGEEVGR